MKEIKLTQGKVALVDDGDFEWLAKWKWYAIKRYENKFYAGRKADGKVLLMHRFILGITDGKVFSDHINREGLDNRRSNLRSCSRSENQCNQSSHKDSISSFIGVTFHKGTGKWQAGIRKYNKYWHLGLFKNETDAALAYNKQAKIFHGEFANLNNVAI